MTSPNLDDNAYTHPNLTSDFSVFVGLGPSQQCAINATTSLEFESDQRPIGTANE